MLPGVGETVAGYRLQTVLGEGSMGVVYRALAPDGREVALKLIKPESPRDRFLAEAESLAQMRSPGIPLVYEYAVEPVAFLAEELMEGTTLEDRLAQGPMSEAEALEVADSLLTVLQVIHEHGFVHRDLSPGNLLLRGKQVCVVDFGLVRLLNAEFHPTRTGEILGTPHYLAPEQIDPDLGEISARTDVFTAGTLVYRMLTGSPPTPEASLPRVMRHILLEAPPPMVGISQALEGAVLHALEKAPSARYSSAQEFAQALRSAAPQEGNS